MRAPFHPEEELVCQFQGYSKRIHLRQRKPATIEIELKVVVKDVARAVPVDKIHMAVANVWKKYQVCIQAEGDHFKAFQKTAIVVLHYPCIY